MTTTARLRARNVAPTNLRSAYDVVIIGSGVGGLVCGNYLAQAGASVLVVEKHYVAGGYCSSFWKDGYYFDAGAHYLGSCRPEGQIGKLISDHGLGSRLKLAKCDPSDVIVSQRGAVEIHSDPNRLIQQLQSLFPKERSAIEKFFNFIQKTDALALFVALKGITFKELLDSYFSAIPLKSILTVPLGNIGLPSSEASALTSVFLYREFILDGGYYPLGGMQRFPDVLVERLEEYGGEVALLTPADEIVIRDGVVDSVRLLVGGRKSQTVKAKAVVANCDPYQLRKLVKDMTDIQRADIDTALSKKQSTISAVMVHLGINHDIRGIAKYPTNVWYYPGDHIDEYYEELTKGRLGLENGFFFYSIPSFHDANLLPTGRHTIQAIIGAPFKTRSEWEKGGYAEMVAEQLINRIEKVIPGLKKWIAVQLVATPPTLAKFTLNHLGAMYGWAATPSQVGNFDDMGDAFGNRIYVVGHWAGIPAGHSGIPTVVTSGRTVARKVLRGLKGIRVTVA